MIDILLHLRRKVEKQELKLQEQNAMILQILDENHNESHQYTDSNEKVHHNDQHEGYKNNNDHEDDNQDHDESSEMDDKLPSDSYTYMIVSEPGTVSWNVGLGVWVLQVGIYVFLINDQVLQRIVYQKSDGPTENMLRLPPVVSPFVTVAQGIAIIVSSWMQEDVFVAAQLATRLSGTSNRRSVWSVVETHLCPNSIASSRKTWLVRIVLPCFLKGFQGLLGMIVTVVVILQNEKIIDLFKDFTALVFIGELDELIYVLSFMNQFGQKVKRTAQQIDKYVIPSPVNRWRKSKYQLFRIIQVASVFLMIVIWLIAVYYQRSGIFISNKYPNCKFDPDDFREWFELGNEDCKKKYNNPACGFDGGDCDAFNLRYPNCINATDPFKIGDGICHNEYNTPECRFDGYDCYDGRFINCNVLDVERLGDGKCDAGAYNSENCEFDGGDCVDFNQLYPGCKVKNPALVGNGFCNHDDILSDSQRSNPLFIKALMKSSTLYASAACGFDGGDCLAYLFSKCPVSSFAGLDDGICHNSEAFNNAECGFDGGDCIGFNFLYPNCPVPFDYWLYDDNCGNGGNSVAGGPERTASCNFGGNSKCLGNEFPECDLTSPPFMSRGYCRPECGFSKDNGNCTYFEDKYPHCKASDLSLIGNGVCDHSEYNIAECGYEDYDCVEVTLDCVVNKPEWIGDGVCHAGISSLYNTTECGYDGGDCVEANANRRTYNCTYSDNPQLGDNSCSSWLFNTEDCAWEGNDCLEFNQQYPKCFVQFPFGVGNGICSGFHYNTEECGFDGGDCDVLNEKFPTLYPDFNASFPNCSVDDPRMLFDDLCQAEWIDDLVYTLNNAAGNTTDSPEIEALRNYWVNVFLAYNTTECGYDNGACLK